MKQNIGKNERIIRIILGSVIGFAGIYYRSWLGLIAIIPLVTGAIGFCPLYVPLKINTNKK